MPLLLSLSTAQAKLLDGVRAVVQDKAILYSDVTERVRAVKESPALASILGVQASTYNDTSALEQLIEEKLILVASKELGVEPTDAEVSKQIGVIASQNQLSIENLKKSLKGEKIDFDMYKANITLQLAKRAVIEKELRSSTTSISDQELETHLQRNAPEEILVSMVKSGRRPALNALRAQILKSGAVSDKTLKNSGAVDLGWSNPTELNPAFQEAILKAGKSAKATSVFSFDGSHYLLVLRGRRVGTGGNLEQSKEILRQQLQAKDIEQRFNSWLEQKKKTINVVVNKS